MRTYKLLTLDQIVETTQPQLIVELLTLGLPSEKISDAILILKDSMATMFKSELRNGNIEDLVRLLSGATENTVSMQTIVDDYANKLTSTLRVDTDLAVRISQHLIPFAIQATGDHLPTSNLNRVGISNLVSSSAIPKHNDFLSQLFRINNSLKEHVIKFLILMVCILCS